MITVHAPAKINLHLHVTGKRADGYHFLDSLICFADIGDELSLEFSEKFELEISGDFARTVPQNKNTIIKIVELFTQKFQTPDTIRIHLKKNLPAGAGLGGGSADAAACLRGLCKFWDVPSAPELLNEIALQVGSDVPACLERSPVLMQGIGEILTPAPHLPLLPAVIIWPDIHSSTPKIFNSLALEEFSRPAFFSDSYPDAASLIKDLEATRNDLYLTASGLYADIGVARNLLLANSQCGFAQMSGSGSSVFGLFSSLGNAAKAAEQISALHPDWWICSTYLNSSN